MMKKIMTVRAIKGGKPRRGVEGSGKGEPISTDRKPFSGSLAEGKI